MRDREQGSKLFVKGDIDMVDTLGDIPMIYNTRSANFFCILQQEAALSCSYYDDHNTMAIVLTNRK